VAGPACHGGRSRPARPQLATADQPDAAGPGGRGRDPGAAAAAAAADGAGDRAAAGPTGRHRGPGPAPAWARPAGGAKGQARDRPLPARAAGRADPHGHQEARTDRRRRPSTATRSIRLRRSWRLPAPEAITGDRRSRARGVGWDFLHVAIDDASRLAYSEILPDERQESAVAFLGRALAWFTGLGVTVERVMTDNGSAYLSHAFRDACRTAGLKHKRTRPYTPRTNAQNQRQGRALHPDLPARMGLPAGLPQLGRTDLRHAPLAPRPQPPPTPFSLGWQTSTQPPARAQPP